MRVIIAKDYEEMSRKAANLIAAQITLKPKSVLGLATGSTPLGTYRELIERCNAGDISFAEVTTVNLDEYRGLPRDNDQSYYYFMHKNLFSQVDIDAARTHIPDGMEADSEAACRSYDEIVNSVGGVDLQLLGLGHNGHIGFNEPADAFTKGTNCVDLTDSTIKANARFFASEKDVPTQAYTMGIGTIMAARSVLLIANGEAKAEIVKKAFFGEITPRVPASILQLHPDFTLVIDQAAASLL
ncbi:MAG: glucosamine-6-phosphate deaminase [Firmicutes bacterium]|nr:glucosamine-6-phosphate deaminase [Bacillota bacterium]